MKKNCYHLKVGNEWSYFLLEQSIIKTCHNFNRTFDWLKIINYGNKIYFLFQFVINYIFVGRGGVKKLV